MGWHAIGGQSWSRFLNIIDEYPDQTSAAIFVIIQSVGMDALHWKPLFLLPLQCKVKKNIFITK
jgi:hypothetical protein